MPSFRTARSELLKHSLEALWGAVSSRRSIAVDWYRDPRFEPSPRGPAEPPPGRLRLAEVTALRESDCQLPAHGWGTLTLARSLPVTAKKWTDHGQRHDPRGLKHRDPDAVRRRRSGT